MTKPISATSNSQRNSNKKSNPDSVRQELTKIRISDHQDLFYAYDHTFIIRRLHKFCQIDNIKAEFLPIKEQFYSQSKKAHAVFNNDRRFFTPAFVVGKDIDEYDETPGFDYDRFKQKVRMVTSKISNEKGQILVPRPSSNFCQVCKKEYDDYLEHINTYNHKQLILKEKGSRFINDLVKKYEKKEKKHKKDKKQLKFCEANTEIAKEYRKKQIKKGKEPLRSTKKSRNQPVSISTQSSQIIL